MTLLLKVKDPLRDDASWDAQQSHNHHSALYFVIYPPDL
jgi:hypothetical protein